MAVSKSDLRQSVCDKLNELGCDIDDELPDYIVAMVLNGKSRQHMGKDLGVFLAEQSEPFLDWLMETVKDIVPGKGESYTVKSTARLVTRGESSKSTSSSSRRRSSSQSESRANISNRLLNMAMANAAADTAKAAAPEDDTSSKRHPQPVAEGSSSSASSYSHSNSKASGSSKSSSSSSRRRSRNSPESRRKESSRSSKSRSSPGSRTSSEKPSSVKTKFVVTLTGAEKLEKSYSKRHEPVDEQPQDVLEAPANVQFVINNDLKRKHEDEEQAVDNGLSLTVATGFELETEEAALVAEPVAVEPPAKRSMDRCRFWPNCTSGDSCQYHHPSIPCHNMPACKYGSQCLYVHPDCKFDGRCTKPECPYIHRQQPKGGQVPAPTMQPMPPTAATPSGKGAAGTTICRFHPNCMRHYCPFLHPIACRYADQCTRPGCSFYHAPATAEPVQVPVPDRSAFRWSAKKPHISDRQFAADAASEAVIPAEVDAVTSPATASA